MNAKVPIFIDWKSHPYLGNEVIEWRERISLVRAFYSLDATEKDRMQSFKKINSKQITSFILTDNSYPIKNCIPIYKDEENIVYSVKNCFK